MVNPNKALWEKGDFTRLAQSMRKSGESLVHSLGITHGLKVLDLGCGDGTTALPEAMLGAQVLGVDIAQNLVDAGNQRAREAGLSNVRFQVGDACELNELQDHSFDLVVSISLAPCLHRDRLTSQRPWSASRDRAAGLSWVTGFRVTRRSWPRS